MEWRSVPGWPAYEVSDSGEIRRFGKNKIRRPFHCQDGYLRIAVFNGNYIPVSLGYGGKAQSDRLALTQLALARQNSGLLPATTTSIAGSNGPMFFGTSEENSMPAALNAARTGSSFSSVPTKIPYAFGNAPIPAWPLIGQFASLNNSSNSRDRFTASGSFVAVASIRRSGHSGPIADKNFPRWSFDILRHAAAPCILAICLFCSTSWAFCMPVDMWWKLNSKAIPATTITAPAAWDSTCRSLGRSYQGVLTYLVTSGEYSRINPITTANVANSPSVSAVSSDRLNTAEPEIQESVHMLFRAKLFAVINLAIVFCALLAAASYVLLAWLRGK